eukprot:14717122-Heterocapsa_arctica.AAC.1
MGHLIPDVDAGHCRHRRKVHVQLSVLKELSASRGADVADEVQLLRAAEEELGAVGDPDHGAVHADDLGGPHPASSLRIAWLLSQDDRSGVGSRIPVEEDDVADGILHLFPGFARDGAIQGLDGLVADPVGRGHCSLLLLVAEQHGRRVVTFHEGGHARTL